MYHLTRSWFHAEALINAKNNGADVQVILDQSSLKSTEFNQSYNQLKADNVDVVPSSKGFDISHGKTFLINGTDSYITSINLTKASGTTRDYGVETDDPTIAQDLKNLFQADLQNAQTGGTETPAPISPFLVDTPIPETTNTAGLQANEAAVTSAEAGMTRPTD